MKLNIKQKHIIFSNDVTFVETVLWICALKWLWTLFKINFDQSGLNDD